MPDIIKHSFVTATGKDNKIFADIRYRHTGKKLPLIVLLHGFMAWKDWGFFPYVAEQIAQAGAIVINFSTSHCGVPAGADSIVEADKFASNTITFEIEDTLKIINEFAAGNVLNDIQRMWSGKIFLVGHSRGGAIAVIAASLDKRIGKVVSWSSIDRFVRYPQRQLDKFAEAGFFEFNYSPTGGKLRINKSYLDDYLANIEKYDPKKCVQTLNIPLLFIHGKQDMTVPYKESEGLSKLARNGSFKLIENAGHTFGISHPFTSSTKAFEEVLNNTISFFGL